MDISIFILCYNEEVIIQHTIDHYKRNIPSCMITIYDNESTDNSVKIAKSNGCNIVSWSSNNIIDDYKYIEIKNNCWKHVKQGWIIVIDMDEWLDITEKELLLEYEHGTSILTVNGLNAIGESKTTDLTDINLHLINKYVNFEEESKSLCFLRDKIHEINYNIGAHKCNPIGIIKYSFKQYFNKHMSLLGNNFLVNKTIVRFNRSKEMRSKNLAIHYINDVNKISKNYNDNLKNSFSFLDNIIGYIHVCQKDGWKKSFDMLIKSVFESGLYDNCKEIRIGVVNDTGKAINDWRLQYRKFKIVYEGYSKEYERPTLLHMRKMSEIDDSNTLYFYLHTKGISHFGTIKENPVIDWINLMLYWNITKWNLAIEKLKAYDTYGCNKVINGHYSGNFWWATKTHIQKLQTYIEDHYIAPEDWVVKCKNANHYCIFNSGLEGMGHYFKLYPKELYYNSQVVIMQQKNSRVGFKGNTVFNPDPLRLNNSKKVFIPNHGPGRHRVR